jgi:hypothetical protein
LAASYAAVPHGHNFLMRPSARRYRMATMNSKNAQPSEIELEQTHPD